MKASVLIATRNRAKLLRHCLHSLQNQTTPPLEVVVVDNNSTDDTRAICDGLRQTLPIVYQKERRVGLPFSRNRSMQLAKGELWAFIDDDCIASPKWLKQILAHFQRYPQAVGVIGKTQNACPSNIASAVEYAYYVRWLKNNIPVLNKVGKLSSGLCIDFKNAAFRTDFINKFRFSANAPFGDVGDEDIEIGSRLFQSNKNIYYNPSIKVTHRYSTTIQRLFVRNFWNGYANQVLFQMNGIDTSINYTCSIKSGIVFHDFIQQSIYAWVKKIYPLFSRLGRLYAVATKLKIQPIPPRS